MTSEFEKAQFPLKYPFGQFSNILCIGDDGVARVLRIVGSETIPESHSNGTTCLGIEYQSLKVNMGISDK